LSGIVFWSIPFLVQSIDYPTGWRNGSGGVSIAFNRMSKLSDYACRVWLQVCWPRFNNAFDFISVNKANFACNGKRNKLSIPSYFQVLLLSQAFESILILKLLLHLRELIFLFASEVLVSSQVLCSLKIILLTFEWDCLGLNYFACGVKILLDLTDFLAEGFYCN
jgi:hypothetical protein